MGNTRDAKTPDLVVAGEKFREFLETIAALRHPVTGCPWDNEQSHESLTKYMLEEAYEAGEAMMSGDSDHIAEELGDVLLQVVLNSQVALDEGKFSVVDVIEHINSKMRRRHPHVFEPESASREKSEIKKNWHKIKAEEAEKKGEAVNPKKGFFEKSKVHKVKPALLQSHKIGEMSKRINFDWSEVSEVMGQFESEVAELRAEIDRLKSEGENARPAVLDELGDAFFTLAQVSRHLGVSGEIIAQRGNDKFLGRFKAMEKIAVTQGLDIENADSDQLEQLWVQAKELEVK